jgi:hypothetical protein
MSRDKNLSVLLQLIRNPADPEISVAGCDVDKIIFLAKRHKLIVQLLQFAKLHLNAFTTVQVRQLEEESRKIALRALNQLQELKRITAIFQKKDLLFVAIKGPQLSRMIYGREALKDSVDLDLMLVNCNDLPAVHTLLSESGYTRSNLNDYPGPFRRKLFLIAKREVFYYNSSNRISIDLHIRPGANTYFTEHRFSDFFSRLKQYDLEGTPVTVLSDEAYFVYLCYHGALHQFSRLAWLADIRAFLKLKCKSMDVDEIYTIAGKWKVSNCVDLALRLIKDSFEEEYISIGLPSSWRMKFLSLSCKRVLYHHPGYGITLPGRINRTIYIQFLLKGFAARIDWLYGIMMRKVIQLLAKR